MALIHAWPLQFVDSKAGNDLHITDTRSGVSGSTHISSNIVTNDPVFLNGVGESQNRKLIISANLTSTAFYLHMW